tara:strand:- start:1540 stop:1842 length:303 start_codon:yes stop_codon:yes gene_type:complete
MQTKVMKSKLKKYNKIISKFKNENKNICNDVSKGDHVCTWMCWCEALINRKVLLEQEKLDDLFKNKLINKDIYDAQTKEKNAHMELILNILFGIEGYLGE